MSLSVLKMVDNDIRASLVHQLMKVYMTQWIIEASLLQDLMEVLCTPWIIELDHCINSWQYTAQLIIIMATASAHVSALHTVDN